MDIDILQSPQLYYFKTKSVYIFNKFYFCSVYILYVLKTYYAKKIYIFIRIIPKIINKADIIFLTKLSLSFKNMYPAKTFKITDKAQSGATILTLPN